MKKKINVTTVAYAVAALVSAIGIIGTILFLFNGKKEFVEIVSDGEVIYRIDISDRANDGDYVVEFEGRQNVVTVSGGSVRVTYAQCPDQICVKTGELRSMIPIVCLPNKLIVRFADPPAGSDPPDVIQ